jgi:hypothetical protein
MKSQNPRPLDDGAAFCQQHPAGKGPAGGLAKRSSISNFAKQASLKPFFSTESAEKAEKAEPFANRMNFTRQVIVFG